MSFREKTAWVTLCAILLIGLVLAVHARGLYQPGSGHLVLHTISMCLAAFIVIEVIGYVVLRLRYPKDARAPKDEREQLIHLKALRIAAYVYIVGSFAAIFVTIHILFGNCGAVGTSVLLAFVVAQIANYAARIVYYRLGS